MTTLLFAALPACDADDLLVRPAPAFVGEGGLSLNLASTGAAASAANWNAADRVWVHVNRAGTAVLDTVLAFDAGQAETRLRLPVGTQSERDPVTVAVELRQGTTPLLRSITPAVIEPQKTVTVTARLASTVPSVAAGSTHSCAVTPQGSVSCWGFNDSGQLGSGTVPWVGSATAVTVTGGIALQTVSNGNSYSCGLTAAGAAYCWGSNSSGQLGNGTVATTWPYAQPSPTAVSGGMAFGSISAGGGTTWNGFGAHTCAVTGAGEAYCWGDNSRGQLGTGAGPSAAPQRVEGGIRFRSISAGERFTCGVALSGEAYCWGANDAGKLGDGTTTDRAQPVRVAGGLSFVDVEAGVNHACGLTVSGTAYCWGANWQGQLGMGEWQGQSTAPVAVAGGRTFASLSVGESFTCAVTSGGAGYCWGGNHMGRLGMGTLDGQNVPTPVAGGLTFAFISAGGSHSCGVTTAGAAHCWGDKGHGSIGDGSLGHSDVPVAAAGGMTFSSLSSGMWHHCALNASGAAYCWGANWEGQLGNGANGQSAQQASPVAVTGGITFASISAGSTHTCALTSTGAAHCWGLNDRGQLGIASADRSRSSPAAVAGGLVFAQVSTGWHHSCGVTTSGQGYCWGANQHGQLGNGTTTNASAPVLVSGGMVLSSIRTGAQHTCAVDTAGAAHCWGNNEYGQLGSGTRTSSTTPVAVAGGLAFQSVQPVGADWSIRDAYTCGLTTTGAAYCWGLEQGCQLGIGSCSTGTVHTSPVAVTGGLVFSSLASGSYTSCGVTAAGAAHCWGNNHRGELGIGHKRELIGSTTTDAGSGHPLAVAGGHAFASVQAAVFSTCGLTTAGTVVCWGTMQWGQHGNGSVQFVAAPRPVSGGITFRS